MNDNLKKERKTLVLSFLMVIVLIVVVAGATYAYFTAQTGEGTNVSINATTGTTDSLTFSVSDDSLTINATQANFGQGMGNQQDSTWGKATLLANNNTNEAIANYYVYLQIDKNEIDYTKNKNTPELALSVKKPDGTWLDSIPYLTKLSEDITIDPTGVNTTAPAFDITGLEGYIEIATPKEIKVESATDSGNHTTEETWEIYVTLINLTDDQNANTGKTVNGKLILQGNPIINKESTSEVATTYIKSKVSNNSETEGLFLHDESLANSAQDNSYRYSGNNPNNFVCFGPGSERYNKGLTTKCNLENQFRIIGVFNDGGIERIKLIQSEYATSEQLGIDATVFAASRNSGNANLARVNKTEDVEAFRWDDGNSNTWNTSSLYKTLNEETQGYLHYLGENWKNKIDEVAWKQGGHDSISINAKTMFDKEITNNTTIVNAKIGLMYVSDYGFAASPENWITNLDNYNIDNNIQNNWLYNALNEWVISPRSDSQSIVSIVSHFGFLYFKDSYAHNGNIGLRPSFYLLHETKIINDELTNGSQSRPFRIEI